MRRFVWGIGLVSLCLCVLAEVFLCFVLPHWVLSFSAPKKETTKKTKQQQHTMRWKSSREIIDPPRLVFSSGGPRLRQSARQLWPDNSTSAQLTPEFRSASFPCSSKRLVEHNSEVSGVKGKKPSVTRVSGCQQCAASRDSGCFFFFLPLSVSLPLPAKKEEKKNKMLWSKENKQEPHSFDQTQTRL